MLHRSITCLFCILQTLAVFAADPLDVWPEMAPGESTRNLGTEQPRRANENPPVTRVINITRPRFTVHLAEKPNGSAAVILPGGGFAKVVPDKEGTEAADWLNQNGVTAFVLSYRTTQKGETKEPWIEPLQDAQRTISLVRSRADEWGLKEDRIGMIAFSAGGQVGARLLSDGGKKAFDPIDQVDAVSHRPDFAILVYPWKIYDEQSDSLVDGVQATKDCPPTYIAHTHDDRSSSLGAVYFYSGLKKLGIESELHVYGNGGHGYGMRPVKGSQISSWTDHAMHWLGTQGFLD